MPFTLADIPDQTGKLAVITGATGGLGYETALALAGAGATVVLTGRNAAKGADALARVRGRTQTPPFRSRPSTSAASPRSNILRKALQPGMATSTGLSTMPAS